MQEDTPLDEFDAPLTVAGQPPAAEVSGELEILFDADNPIVEKGQLLARIKGCAPGSSEQSMPDAQAAPLLYTIPAIIPDNTVERKDNEFYSARFGRATFSNNTLAVHKVINVKVGSDAMEALLSCLHTKMLTPDKIKEELAAKKITHGIDERAIEDILSSCAPAGTPIKDFPVAKGTPATQGKDGEIKYHFHTGKGLSLHEHIEDGVITQGIHVVKSVEKDAEVAFIIPHEEPRSGKNIFGKAIPVQHGVRKVALRAGQNVKASENGLHFFAAVSGFPVVERDTISISDKLTISGNQDYTVGNIDFDGIVEILGDVADGFKVKATKTIFIRGIVGACDVEAGLDIQIEGGCNGQDKARITCGRNLEAKYLDEAHVSARGNIIVKNEIVSCHIVCLGRVYVKSGSICGGNIMAKKGIEAGNIGNDMNIKIMLVPGEDFELNEKIRVQDEAIAEKSKEISEITKRIAPLLKNEELLKKLPEDAQHKINETIQYLNVLKQERDSLNQRKSDLLAEAAKDAVPEVVVYRNIYAGGIIRIGKSRREISSRLEGPLRLYAENDQVTVEPYSKKTK